MANQTQAGGAGPNEFDEGAAGGSGGIIPISTNETLSGVETSLFERALNLGAEMSRPFIGIDGHQYAPMIESGIIKYMKIPNPDPVRIKASPTFDVQQSFSEYVNEFKDLGRAKTQIFVDMKAKRFHAALDYHAPDSPQHGDHNAYFSPRTDPTFDIWSAANGKYMSQDAFVSFLEEQGRVIVAPDAATILEIAQDLNIDVRVSYKSKKNTSNNLVQITYAEESDGAQTSNKSIDLPKEMTIRLPVFFSGETYQFKVFLRLGLKKGEPIKFKLDIHQMDETLESALLDVAQRIKENTGLSPKCGLIG